MGHFGPNVTTNIFVQPRYQHGGCGFSREMIRTYSRVCYTKMGLHLRSPVKSLKISVFSTGFLVMFEGDHIPKPDFSVELISWTLREQFAIKSCLT